MKAEEIPVAELEAELIAFLDAMSNKPGGPRTKPGCNLVHGQACALGTCVDNVPRVTPIDLYNDGLTPWLSAEPGGKIANIKRNPNVSIGVYEPVDHSRPQKSLQIWGTAELVNVKNNPEEFNRRVQEFGIEEAIQGMIEELALAGKLPERFQDASYRQMLQMMNLVKVVPSRMVLLEMKPAEFPVQKIWEPGSAQVRIKGA